MALAARIGLQSGVEVVGALAGEFRKGARPPTATVDTMTACAAYADRSGYLLGPSRSCTDASAPCVPGLSPYTTADTLASRSGSMQQKGHHGPHLVVALLGWPGRHAGKLDAVLDDVEELIRLPVGDEWRQVRWIRRHLLRNPWAARDPDCRGRDDSRSRSGRHPATPGADHRVPGPAVPGCGWRQSAAWQSAGARQVMRQWPELALIGTSPDTTTSKPPVASMARSTAILTPQRCVRFPWLEPGCAATIAPARQAESAETGGGALPPARLRQRERRRAEQLLSSRIMLAPSARAPGPAATRPSARGRRRDRRRHRRGA